MELHVASDPEYATADEKRRAKERSEQAAADRKADQLDRIAVKARIPAAVLAKYPLHALAAALAADRGASKPAELPYVRSALDAYRARHGLT